MRSVLAAKLRLCSRAILEGSVPSQDPRRFGQGLLGRLVAPGEDFAQHQHQLVAGEEAPKAN